METAAAATWRWPSSGNRSGEEAHGSDESFTYWGKRGFCATTLQDCKTWLVLADMVD